jgi:hypothetical protein
MGWQKGKMSAVTSKLSKLAVHSNRSLGSRQRARIWLIGSGNWGFESGTARLASANGNTAATILQIRYHWYIEMDGRTDKGRFRLFHSDMNCLQLKYLYYFISNSLGLVQGCEWKSLPKSRVQLEGAWLASAELHGCTLRTSAMLTKRFHSALVVKLELLPMMQYTGSMHVMDCHRNCKKEEEKEEKEGEGR